MIKTSNLVVRATGVSFLDGILRGGASAGQVYAILGQDEFLHTTLGVQIAVEGADFLATIHDGGSDPKRWIFATANVRASDIFERAFSCATKLPLNMTVRLHQLLGDGWNDDKQIVTALHNLKIHDEDQGVLEARVFDFRNLIRSHLSILDMTDSDCLGWASIARHLFDSVMTTVKSTSSVGGVVIHGLGSLVNRRIAGTSQDDRDVSRCLHQFLLECRSELAIPLNCPVWVLHELKPALARESPTKLFSGKDAANCRKLGESVDTIITMSNAGRGGDFTVACMKHPSGAAPDNFRRQVRLDGAAARLIETAPTRTNQAAIAVDGGPGEHLLIDLGMDDELRSELGFDD